MVAHKKGVQVLHCRPGAQGQLPDYATRQKIERKTTPDVRELLIAFTNEAKTLQVWQWVTRQSGKPAQYREVFFRQGEYVAAGQPVLALLPADAVVRRNPADKRRQSLLSRIQVFDGDGAYVLD